MILDYRTIDLYDHMLFEKVILSPPYRKDHPMSNEACFLYIVDGEYNAISQNQQLRIQAEESVLMKCGNYLSQMFASPHRDRYEAIAVHFFPEVLKKVYHNKLPHFLTSTQDIQDKRVMDKIHSHDLINKYMEGVRYYFQHPSLVNEDLLILKLKEIILLLHQTENAPYVNAILSNLFNPHTFTFREIIEAHLYTSISIPELAHLTNMSLSTFKREFSRVYNTSPAAYLMNHRITKAGDLLKVSDKRISDIAFECGFNNLSHFSSAFKQQFGVSPSRYRLSRETNL